MSPLTPSQAVLGGEDNSVAPSHAKEHVPSAAEQMFDADCRIEEMIWLPGMGGQDSLAEAFGGFVDYLPECEDAPLYSQLPLLAKFRDREEGPETEEVADCLIFAGVGGFLFQVATPVRRYPKPDADYCFSSWGHYYTEWLYAASEAEIATACLAWAASKTLADKAKAEGKERDGSSPKDPIARAEGVSK